MRSRATSAVAPKPICTDWGLLSHSEPDRKMRSGFCDSTYSGLSGPQLPIWPSAMLWPPSWVMSAPHMLLP